MSRPTPDAEKPAYLRKDPGLACLTLQLERTNEYIRCLGRLKKSFADAETSLEKSTVSSSSSKDQADRDPSAMTASSSDQDANQWVKCYDTEVKADYFYNHVTGEASWLDPRYGNMAV